jgi:hypothetical protein
MENAPSTIRRFGAPFAPHRLSLLCPIDVHCIVMIVVVVVVVDDVVGYFDWIRWWETQSNFEL